MCLQASLWFATCVPKQSFASSMSASTSPRTIAKETGFWGGNGPPNRAAAFQKIATDETDLPDDEQA